MDPEASAGSGERLKKVESGRVTPPPHYSVATQAGVVKAEALRSRKVWGRTSTFILFFGVALMAYVYSLDGTTTWFYQINTTSEFDQHSLIGSVATISAIVIAVGKPIAAKVADVLGRTEAWTLAIILYTIGYIILAACQNVGGYAAGWLIRSAGYAAVQILMQIVIGDVTTLRWRTLSSALVSAPYFINGFVGSKISASIQTSVGWRWGYGMFAILFPVCSIPIIGILAWSQIKARRSGLVHSTNPYEAVQVRETVGKIPLARSLLVWSREMDLVGLILFTAGWTCLLLPITLANSGTLQWSSYKIITMLVIGPILLIVLTFYEARFAHYPFIPARFLKNRTVLAAALIGLFDFISFYLQFTYQYSFISVAKDWTQEGQNYFGQTQTISLTFFAIIAGAIVLFTRRYKWLLLFGLLVRLLGVGLMIHSKGAHGSTGELVVVQILQGAGGGFAAVLAQTAAQASVAHQDLASVTAVVLIFAEIGNAIGSAITTAIWRNIMPGQLQEALEGLANQTVIDSIYGSTTIAATYPAGSPIREGTIHAYTYTMKIILIVATIFAVIPPCLVFMMKDIRFGDQHNDVEGRAPGGESVDDISLDDGGKKQPLA